MLRIFTISALALSKYSWLAEDIFKVIETMGRLYAFDTQKLRRMITEEFLIAVSENEQHTASIAVMPFAHFYFPHLRGDPIILTIGIPFWGKLPSFEDKAFVLAHEIGHLMMEHIWRTEAWKDAGLTHMDRNMIFDCTVHEAFSPTPWIEQNIKPVTRKTLFLDRGIQAEPKKSSDYYATLYIKHRPPMPQMSKEWFRKMEREANKEDERDIIDKIVDDIVDTIQEEVEKARKKRPHPEWPPGGEPIPPQGPGGKPGEKPIEEGWFPSPSRPGRRPPGEGPIPPGGEGKPRPGEGPIREGEGGLTPEQKEEIKKNAKKIIDELKKKSREEIKKILDEYRKQLKNEMYKEITKPPSPDIVRKMAGTVPSKDVREIIDINSIIEYREYDWSEVFRRLMGEVFNRVLMEETWSRPWKKTGYPPGVIYYPPAKIGLVIDVSGSMGDCIEEIAGEIKHAVKMSQPHNIEWIVVEVDAAVRRVYKITPDWTKFGIGVPSGGTVIGKGILALNEAIEIGNYSAVIIGTDGYLAEEVLPLPRTNLVIALYPEKHKSIKDCFERKIPIIEVVVKKEKRFVKD